MIQVPMIKTKSHIDKAIERIKEFEPEEGYILAFSGGKDSITIYRLAQMAGVKFEAHYNHTTADPPELIYFIKENYPDVIIDYPDITMWDLIVKKLYPPTRISRYCCDVLKERGGMGRFVITGVRWAESYKRKKTRTAIENYHKNIKYQIHSNDNDEGRKLLENCIKKGKFILNPIVDWSDYQLWNFIKNNNIKYCKLYNEGYERLGCIGCPMASYKKRLLEFERYPKYKQMYIRAFERMLIERKKRGLDTNWKTGEDVLNWWIDKPNPVKKTPLENQIELNVEEEYQW